MLVLAEQNRAFGYAIGASLALHTFLLLNLPAFREAVAPPPEPPLVAHLVEPPAPPAPAAPEVRKPEPPKPEPPKPAPPRHAAKPKPRTLPRPTAIPEPAPPPPVAQAPPAALAAPPAAGAPAPAPAVAVAPPARPDPAAERDRFRQRLIQRAEQLKRYPKRAVDEGWTGRVTVRVEMADDGSLASVRVESSSGNSLLDAVAVQTFATAAAEVAVPPALRGKAFAVEVPMLYKFTD
jgi:protein TonB